MRVINEHPEHSRRLVMSESVLFSVQHRKLLDKFTQSLCCVLPRLSDFFFPPSNSRSQKEKKTKPKADRRYITTYIMSSEKIILSVNEGENLFPGTDKAKLG